MFYSVFIGCFCCVFLLVEISYSETTDEGVSDLTLQELLRKINEQDHKISTLEAMAKKDRKELTTKISNLEAKIRRSDSRQSKLEKRIDRMKKIISDLNFKTVAENVEIDSIPNGDYRKNSTEKTKQTAIYQTLKAYSDYSNSSDVHKSQRKRILTGFTFPQTHKVAFYAYLSKFEKSPGVHHTVIFDTVITNVGSFYNHHDGIFTTPTNGVYVFIWNLYSSFHDKVMSELMVNSASKGTRLSSGYTVNEDHSSSGTVVVEISQGDVVYIRTHSTFSPIGDIVSYANLHQSSFCGCRLV
ncbi:uncharacterized protein LOC134277488 [Saccostrea cucullata]|uniref:uncharacterized protein LOC134277488 n=1 Tax=Saccostrea cuccullata TaxID=36930 RepID=UPI002ED1241A